MEDCTGEAFPPQGINIFAIMMRTHQIAKEVKLRQVSFSKLLVLINESQTNEIATHSTF